MHNLSLSFPDNTDCKTLVIQDASLYDDTLPITNTLLEINPPTKNIFTSFSLSAKWCSLVLDCLSFEFCCPGECQTVLPDGNYEIKYSVDPILTTLVEYNHFRVCQLRNLYIKALLIFFATKCDFTKAEIKCRTKALREIDDLINAAIYMAEECLNVTKAIELYNEASKKLGKISGKDGCICNC